MRCPKALPRSVTSDFTLGDNTRRVNGEAIRRFDESNTEPKSFCLCDTGRGRIGSREREMYRKRGRRRGQSLLVRVEQLDRRLLKLEKDGDRACVATTTDTRRCRVVSCQLAPSLYKPLLANLTRCLSPVFVSFTGLRRCSPHERCCIRTTPNDNETETDTRAPHTRASTV